MSAAKKMTARNVMSAQVTCVDETASLLDAAKMMRDLGVGAVPICGTDQRLKGMITDRDIVIRCIAEGRDPASVKAGELGGELQWIAADADMADALSIMERHQIKRLPVIDVENNHALVGMISEADLARNLSDEQLATFVEHVYAAR